MLFVVFAAVEIKSEEILRPRIRRALQRVTAELSSSLPDALIEHVGATAVPGSLTKGDLDVLVRVPESQFQPAAAQLKRRFAPKPENRPADLASFEAEPEDGVLIGVQLVVAGGRTDRLFVRWRDRLIQEPDLLQRYNEFKQEHRDLDYPEYTEAKAKFIERELGESMG
jgi:GrpB-like predicted nucleotidyltransferase (UPF0157 family)